MPPTRFRRRRVPGATEATYEVQAADVGYRPVARVSYTDDDGFRDNLGETRAGDTSASGEKCRPHTLQNLCGITLNARDQTASV